MDIKINNIMVIGEDSIGKRAFINSLFANDLKEHLILRRNQRI
jgi:septin family protein